MHEGEYLEVCHHGASIGSATPSRLGWDEGARQATRPVQLKVKEALQIERTPANTRLDRDGGYELPGCWIATMKKLRGRANRTGTNDGGASALTSTLSRMGAQAQHPRL